MRIANSLPWSKSVSESFIYDVNLTNASFKMQFYNFLSSLLKLVHLPFRQFLDYVFVFTGEYEFSE